MITNDISPEAELAVACDRALAATEAVHDAVMTQRMALHALANLAAEIAGIQPGDKVQWAGKRYFAGQVYARAYWPEVFVFITLTPAKKDGTPSLRDLQDGITLDSVTPGWPE